MSACVSVTTAGSATTGLFLPVAGFAFVKDERPRQRRLEFLANVLVGAIQPLVISRDVHRADHRPNRAGSLAPETCGRNDFVERIAEAPALAAGSAPTEPKEVLSSECHRNRLFWHKHLISEL